MNKTSKNKPLYLFSLHIPVLVAILLATAIGFGTISKAVLQTPSTNVLADEDEDDDSDDEGEDKDENDEEDMDEDEDKDDDRDDDDRDEDREDEKNSEDKDDDDDEEERIELVSNVTNPNGTTTKTYRITEDNEVEMKAYVYDSNGKKIDDIELNDDGTPKVEDDDDEMEDENEDEDEDRDELEIEFEYKNKTAGTTQLPYFVEAELEQEIKTNSKLGTTIDKVELEVKTTNGKYEYEGTTFKDGKLFGLFDVNIPIGIEIDPETGRILSVNQSFWSTLLDFLSL